MEKPMKRLLILAGLITLIPTMSFAADKGMISKKSHHSVKVTLDRLENVLRKKGKSVV